MLIIEFVGLPGAGKSTLCSALCAAGRAGEWVLVPSNSGSFGASATSHLPWLPRKLIAVWRILYSILRYPRIAWHFLRFGLASRPRSLWKLEQSFSGLSMVPRLAAERTARRTAPEALVFEQGVVQLFGSIAVPGDARRLPDPHALTRALLPGFVSGLVWVDCPQSVVLDRLRKRPFSRSRFNDWNDAKVSAGMAAMRQVLEAAVAEAEAAGVAVLRVDALQPVETNVARIAAWLAGLDGRATPGVG